MTSSAASFKRFVLNPDTPALRTTSSTRSMQMFKMCPVNWPRGYFIKTLIGDQVPADGVLISGHSLAIDESSMTCESKISHRRRGANKNSTKEATKNEKGEEGSLKRKKRRNKKK
ncbi:hypothetical protein YC2023_104507 [Brassica napus]